MEVDDEELSGLPLCEESNAVTNQSICVDECPNLSNSQTSSSPSLGPLVIDEQFPAPVPLKDDDYDRMRQEDEEKISRYASLTPEEADAMDREYSTFSKIPSIDGTSIYRQKVWFKSFDGKLKNAKRKPLKPTTSCKYFLEFWSEHDENLIELSCYNADYVEEPEKRKMKTEVIAQDNLLDNLDESVKRIKIDQVVSQKSKEDWKLPTYYEYKQEIEGMFKDIIVCDDEDDRRRRGVSEIDLASVDGFIKTSLGRLKEEVSDHFRKQAQKLKNKEMFVMHFVEESPIEESGFKKVVISTLKPYDESGMGLEFGHCVHLKVFDPAGELTFDHVSVVDQVMIDDSPQPGEGLVVKYLVVLVVDSSFVIESREYRIELKSLGLFNHFFSSARVLINFKQFHLHEQIVHPKLSSFSSGSSASVNSPKVQFESFHRDAIQKAVDTVSISAPNCSSICVIDCDDMDILKEIIVPITKSCLINEPSILDPNKSDLQVLDEQSEGNQSRTKKLDKLRIIITAKDNDKALHVPTMLKEIVNSCKRDYQCYYISHDRNIEEFPSRYHFEQRAVEELRSKINDEGRELSDQEVERIQTMISAYENPKSIGSARLASLREDGLKASRSSYLRKNQIIIGSLPDLFNNDCILDHFDKDSYHVAIVYNASAVSDLEIVSLLNAGVEKLILIGCSARKDLVEFNLMDRMVKDYEKNVKSFISGSKCSVVSSFSKIEPPPLIIKKEPADQQSRDFSNRPLDNRSEFSNRGTLSHRGGRHDRGGHRGDQRFGGRGFRQKPYGNPSCNVQYNRGTSDDSRSDVPSNTAFGEPQHRRQEHNWRGYHNDDREYHRNHRGNHTNRRGQWNNFGQNQGRGRGHQGGYRNRTGHHNNSMSIDNPMHPHYKPRAGTSGHGNCNPTEVGGTSPLFPSSLLPGFDVDTPDFQNAQRRNNLPPF